MFDFEFEAKRMVVQYFNELISRKGWKDIGIEDVEVLEGPHMVNPLLKRTILRTTAQQKRIRYEVFYHTRTKARLVREI